ncbi:acyl-CoA dehydratase activase [Dethiobacter alkaliphilus]|uniref:CoA-substrate-specific enzyme activase n=1 Tax=Dethiobacter alkaliphilus AHT 1 TaxID=555088 RepID=C0GJV4_DETAL|nr:acyl-CoA dehydratase activase [Dethiobacter alkaliphilus]EEG76412.1 CoA-substrate-specific enzyme activase [Dethiobacter alkaliphilus AHT 1]MCW3489223.1 acyl-CoA dehydratase activase [Dethiobacter alkaliphilus]
MDAYLGIDVGSVSTNMVIINEEGQVLANLYMRTQGQPIKAVQEGMRKVEEEIRGKNVEICGVGTTGSARTLTGVIVGADTVKNEITAHAVAASFMVPDVQTVLEIGGQDSKIILLRDGIVVDFAMNTVCAAGTGSFLDHQAERLNTPIEEFGSLALQSKGPVRIAGRCSVFAESDMIHKQQMGHSAPDIIAGLCDALVRNYLNNVGKGKEILSPVVFQGGVAANVGIRAAFEKALGVDIVIPEHYSVMGAVGAALLAKSTAKEKQKTDFRGFAVSEMDYQASSFECQSCPNLCEIVNISVDDEILARWGGRCGKWETLQKTG